VKIISLAQKKRSKSKTKEKRDRMMKQGKMMSAVDLKKMREIEKNKRGSDRPVKSNKDKSLKVAKEI